MFLEKKNYAYHYELASTEDTGKFLSKREFFGPNPIEILAERLSLIEDDSDDNIIYLKKQYDDTSLENLKNALSLYGEKGKKWQIRYLPIILLGMKI